MISNPTISFALKASSAFETIILLVLNYKTLFFFCEPSNIVLMAIRVPRTNIATNKAKSMTFGNNTDIITPLFS